MRSRYEVIKSSSIKNKDGESYPDVLSFPVDKFDFDDPLKEVVITQKYKERFYLLCYEEYGTSQYDDIILWINGISTTHIIEPGEIVYLPSKKDINKFLLNNRVDNS